MTLFKDHYGDRIRINVGRSLTGATSFEMIFQKPSGTTVTKVATQYDDTRITYTTVEGDIDEAGVWKVTPRVAWGTDSKLPGDAAFLEVIEIGDVSQTQIIDALAAYTFIETVQSADEYNEGENEDAMLTYPVFATMCRKAKGDLAKVLAAAKGLELSDDDELAALAYLVADLYLKKNPTWSAKSLSTAPGESITRSGTDQTDMRKAFDTLISEALAASTDLQGGICAPDDDGEVLVHDDETYYQDLIEGGYDATE